MNIPSKEWIDFLREQYPVGSRIKLREMKDPYAPVEPGTMGILENIDDMGTFHVKWDNGRGLGLVIGEDRFTVMSPALNTLKLYMPLTADLFGYNDYGDLEDDSVEMDGRELREHEAIISAALTKNRLPEEKERGLMQWYGEDDQVERKVHSAVFAVESRAGQLWGVAECQVAGELTATELNTLKEYISGQASDGWGEGFEQMDLDVDDGILNVHLWNGERWSICSEQEKFGPVEGLPDMCWSVLPGSGSLICIRNGESGYCPSDWNTNDPQKNRETADFANQQRGITKAQEKAMLAGSMHGWDVPAADPRSYDESGQLLAEPNQDMTMGGMTLG